jgi:CheY-like chemotaxis protein
MSPVYAGAPSPLRPLHGLVVEDNATNQLVITLFLRKLCIAHDLVDRGAQALEALRGRSYDFVLMDVEMPQLDGFATTRGIRAWERAGGHPRTPVIGLSADAMPASRRQAREAGMDEFLTKPIAMDALRAMLAGLHALQPGTA